MSRYRLMIAYDGTGYGGWQVQKNAPTIQKLVQQALETVLQHPTDLTGASRTDAGVHALGQVAHFDTEKTFLTPSLRLSLNALLPETIRILEVEPVSDEFHARYSAKSKIYSYHLHLDPILSPFFKLYRHQVFGSFDIALLKKAIPLLVGKKDFTSFANQSDQKDTVRDLYRIDLFEEEGGIRLEFEGNGFLYKMVRNLTGTLIEIAQHKLDITQIPLIFAAKNRKEAGQTAPAKGLFLNKVIYSEDESLLKKGCVKMSRPCALVKEDDRKNRQEQRLPLSY